MINYDPNLGAYVNPERTLAFNLDNQVFAKVVNGSLSPLTAEDANMLTYFSVRTDPVDIQETIANIRKHERDIGASGDDGTSVPIDPIARTEEDNGHLFVPRIELTEDVFRRFEKAHLETNSMNEIIVAQRSGLDEKTTKQVILQYEALSDRYSRAKREVAASVTTQAKRISFGERAQRPGPMA